MIFNQSNGLLLNQKYSPVNGKYKFQVLEMYDDLSPSYTIEVPSSKVNFEPVYGNKFEFSVEEGTFNKLVSQCQSCGCRELYIYPKFV